MQSDWFKDWFSSEEYNQVYFHRDDNDAKKLIDLILSKVNISKDHTILDAACGSGRHMNYLSSLGYNVVGFDLSKPFLLEAKKNNPSGNFLRSDLREVTFKEQFDLVLNLFTSFGYFSSDDENFRFPKNAFGFLRKGGYYMLDYLNPDYLTGKIIPYSVKEFDGLKIEESRSIEEGRVVKRISITKEGRRKEFVESVKLYPKDFILEQFQGFGYSVNGLFGGYDGSAFDAETSTRLIMIFKK